VNQTRGDSLRIKVVFLQDVYPRYQAGDIAAVAGGYARNYLIPKNIAVPATREQLKHIENIREFGLKRREREAESTTALFERLNGLTITIQARAGENGRLYGSVTNMRIAEELERVAKEEIDRRLIDLPEPIRAVGVFPVFIRLPQGVTPVITVTVESDGHQVASTEEESASGPESIEDQIVEGKAGTEAVEAVADAVTTEEGQTGGGP
jgi:large subunit ribosomal protein L9